MNLIIYAPYSCGLKLKYLTNKNKYNEINLGTILNNKKLNPLNSKDIILTKHIKGTDNYRKCADDDLRIISSFKYFKLKDINIKVLYTIRNPIVRMQTELKKAIKMLVIWDNIINPTEEQIIKKVYSLDKHQTDFNYISLLRYKKELSINNISIDFFDNKLSECNRKLFNIIIKTSRLESHDRYTKYLNSLDLNIFITEFININILTKIEKTFNIDIIQRYNLKDIIEKAERDL